MYQGSGEASPAMADSPLNLSSLCSTPLFGGMDFLGCPVNTCYEEDFCTEFVDPGDFFVYSDSEDEVFKKNKAKISTSFSSTNSSEMDALPVESNSAVSQLKCASRQGRMSQENDPQVDSVENLPKENHRLEEKQISENGLIRSGKDEQCLQQPTDSEFGTKSGQNLKNDTQSLGVLKVHFLSSEKLDYLFSEKAEYRICKNNEEDVKPQGKNNYYDREKDGTATKKYAHSKSFPPVRRSHSKSLWKPDNSVVSNSDCLNFVNVDNVWPSYTGCNRGARKLHEDKDYADKGGKSYSCLTKNAMKNSTLSDKYERMDSKRPGRRGKHALSSLTGSQIFSAHEPSVPISRGKTKFSNSISLPLINTSLTQPSLKKERALLKLPKLSSNDILLKYWDKHLELIEGESRQARNRSKRTSKRN